MAINLEKSIQFMYDLQKKGIYYSMTGCRDGVTCNSGDCSGTITRSLERAGCSTPAWLYNTDSMHAWLEQNGFKLIAANKSWTAKRGDIVIFGKKGASGGAAGHVVEFINNTQIIHCTYKNPSMNGIYVDNEATTCPYYMGWYVYRHPNGFSSNVTLPTPPATAKPDKVGWYDEKGTFTITINEPINIRDKAVDGKIIGTLKKGDRVKYDQFTHKDGHVWIRQPRANGTYGFIATGRSNGVQRLDYWGTFS